MTTACGLPWLILMGGPSFLGSGFLSLMLAYYWTWLLLKSPNLLGLPPPEWVENINHISLDNISKPVWGNDAFRVFLFGGRRCSFLSLFFFYALRKFGLVIFPYARRTDDDDRTDTFFFLVQAAQESHSWFLLFFHLWRFASGCSSLQVSCCWVQWTVGGSPGTKGHPFPTLWTRLHFSTHKGPHERTVWSV